MARILVRNFNGFPSVPSAPTGVTATPGNAKVTLSWNATAGASNYKVRRSTTSGSGYVDVATVSGTSHIDMPVTNGVTYYYVIAGVNSNGSVGLNSGQVSAMPQ
jgi:fibronectin type 3 domain-containing protein